MSSKIHKNSKDFRVSEALKAPLLSKQSKRQLENARDRREQTKTIKRYLVILGGL
jgi:hypothetical protein